MVASKDSKPQATVFYSWQSDLPNSTNRGVIQDALQRAAKMIAGDDSVAVEPVPDRDTQNVPGAPDIAHTIFQKIDNAAVFVADVSIINPGLGRPTPNPNVLIELGYALKAMGNLRTILVSNTASGPVEALPFDLRTKRVLTYHLPAGAKDKPEQRKKLESKLETALRAILAQMSHVKTKEIRTAYDIALESIEKRDAAQAAFCERFMQRIADRVKEQMPVLHREESDSWGEKLREAIHQSLPFVTEFARMADASAVHNSQEAALALYRGFDRLFTLYTQQFPSNDGYYTAQFDLPKFIGHELLVTLFAALIGADRWQTVAELCRETITIPNPRNRFTPQRSVSYLYASDSKPIELLERNGRRFKPHEHAHILQERHQSGELGEITPWQLFQDADFFLYLRSVLVQKEVDNSKIWKPWTAPLLDGGCPGFLLEATHHAKAERLLEPLGVDSIAELRTRIKERIPKHLHDLMGGNRLLPFYNPVEGLNPDMIGTN